MKYDYRQIIKIPYHQSQAHPRMPMAERAAIFLPFAALSGFEDEIERVKKESQDAAGQQKVKKIDLLPYFDNDTIQKKIPSRNMSGEI